MVAIPLVFSIAFILSLRLLLNEASIAADREARSKEAIALANTFGSEMIQVGAAFYIARTTGKHDSFLSKVDRIRGKFKDLEALMATSKERKSLLVKSRANLEELFNFMATRWEKTHTGQEVASLAEHIEMRNKLKVLLNSIMADMTTLIDEEMRDQLHNPMTSQKYRVWIDGLLFAGIGINCLLALALIASFSSGITKRLSIVGDNSRRLAEEQELNPVLIGSDEIAQLDEAFHSMAEKLADARSRERAVLDSLILSEARLRSMLDTIPLGLLVVDTENRITFLSPSAELLFGYSGAEFQGHPLSDLFVGSGARSTLSLTLGLTAVDSQSREVQACKKDGSRFPVEVLGTEFNTAERNSKLLIVTDVTQKYEVKKLKQSFVSMVSHELRSPLMSVQTCMKMLTKGFFGELNDDGRQSVDMAESSIVRLIALVNEILDVERMESSKISIERKMISMQSILDLALASVATLAQSRSICIESINADAEVFADRERVVQVIVNLLSNAIKFSDNDSKIVVDVEQEISFTKVSITDCGRGIPAEHQELVFDRFHQVSKADASEKGGTGLGLAICKAIVEAHQGEIGVVSQEGRGSTFWFCLPRQKEAA